MRIELPELKRCCCCLPLRRGLLFWTYLKLGLEIICLLYFISCLVLLILRNAIYLFQSFVVVLSLIMLVMDIVFCILFLISAHRKNHEYMRTYYRYSIVMLVLGGIGMLALTGLEVYIAVVSMPYTLFFIHYMVECLCFVFLILMMQAYLVILVRSEILKLENSAKFEFINHTSEPECKAQIPL